MRNKHNNCSRGYQKDLVLYHKAFEGLLPQNSAAKQFLKFLILVYSQLLMSQTQQLEEKYPPP